MIIKFSLKLTALLQYYCPKTRTEHGSEPFFAISGRGKRERKTNNICLQW